MMRRLGAAAVLIMLLLQPIPWAFAWEIERPSCSINIQEATGSGNTTGQVSVGLNVEIQQYDYHAPRYDGADVLELNVSMLASSRLGLEYTWCPSPHGFDLDWVWPGQLVGGGTILTGVGSEWGEWVNMTPSGLGMIFRFYGGNGTSEYTMAWICSNGFVAFDESNSTSPTPKPLTSAAKPDAVVAPLWTDLMIDNQASIYYGFYDSPIQPKCFVVAWWNALVEDGSGTRVSFQTKLEDAPPYEPTISRGYTQSPIWMSWYSVSAIGKNYTMGIEDLTGDKYIGGLFAGASLGQLSQTSREFVQYSPTFYLTNLILQFRDDNPHVGYKIFNDDWLRGYNVQLTAGSPTQAQSDPTMRWATNILGAASFLVTMGGFVVNVPDWITAPFACVEFVQLAQGFADMFAQEQATNVSAVINYSSNPAYAIVPAWDNAVDAALNLCCDWVLCDAWPTGHSLWVDAIVYYNVVDAGGNVTPGSVDTCVNLQIGPDNNDSFGTAVPIQFNTTYSRLYMCTNVSVPADPVDFFKLSTPDIRTIHISAHANTTYNPVPAQFETRLYNASHYLVNYWSPSYNEDVNFILPSAGDWFLSYYATGGAGFYYFHVDAYNNCSLSISTANANPPLGTTSPAPGTYSYPYGKVVTVTAIPNPDYEFNSWVLDYQVLNGPNPINVTMNFNHSLTAFFDDGGGGCPYVSPWNGTCYVSDNSILPDSEMSGEHDTKDYYGLEQPLVPTLQGEKYSSYSLKISEFEHEHDYIDQVQVLAVDHPAGVNVGVSLSGEILTYKHPTPPVSAISSDGADVLSLLKGSDGKYYQGYNGRYITVTFAAADVSAGAKLVVRADDFWIKCPIYVQVINATGQWNTVASFDTRSNWATDIINMTGLLPGAEGNLRVRLCFVSTDEIDYVGLDTTPQAKVQVHEAKLLHALSSWQGDVTQLLKADDEKYAELLPSQQILLTFQLPTSQNSERTFILYTEGHYQTIH
jgi:hypothetical protein